MLLSQNAIQSYAGRLNKRDKVMTLTALSGEFPYSEFEWLNISSSYGKLIWHNFYNDGLMKRTYNKNGLKSIKLTNRGKERLKQKYPKRFGHIADKNITETSRRYRRKFFRKNVLFFAQCRHRVSVWQKAVHICPQTFSSLWSQSQRYCQRRCSDQLSC